MSERDEHGLVMPFVCTTDQGGVYDSRSFVAGARFGKLMEFLTTAKPATHQSYEYPEMVAQLDLLAMYAGYSLTHEPWEGHEDEWTRVVFKRNDEEMPDA